MASVGVLRKDINGQIISKNNYKNYHINFNTNIDIINVKSYKIYNKIRGEENLDENEYFENKEEEEKEEKKENFIDTYEKTECDDVVNKDPRGLSHGGCIIF